MQSAAAAHQFDRQNSTAIYIIAVLLAGADGMNSGEPIQTSAEGGRLDDGRSNIMWATATWYRETFFYVSREPGTAKLSLGGTVSIASAALRMGGARLWRLATDGRR
ncbi:hypothetical protein MUK42_07922 [Musa troglodytarum]|uniref:Uncharacterized protein n=1 Tax=Musa troglodytarum TaxID=320322 RepID=A0A9E7HU33_9LILI|nr:hypothetical protein MUK42_07922 [Musa troglodytarum]